MMALNIDGELTGNDWQLQDGLHLGEIEVAILVAGAVHLHGDFFLGFRPTRPPGPPS